MINDFLTEKDILDYLMTSDFNEGLNQDESRFLLLKYKNFYRAIYAKNEQLKSQLDESTTKLNKIENELMNVKTEYNSVKSDLESKLNKEVNRKLTFIERILGKKIKK